MLNCLLWEPKSNVSRTFWETKIVKIAGLLFNFIYLFKFLIKKDPLGLKCQCNSYFANQIDAR